MEIRIKATTAFLNQYQDENELLEKENDTLKDYKEKVDKELNNIKIEIKNIREIEKIIKSDFDIFEDLEPSVIKAQINLLINIQRQIADKSLEIRIVDGIIYRNGAVDGIGILKVNLQKLLKEAKQKQKK